MMMMMKNKHLDLYTVITGKKRWFDEFPRLTKTGIDQYCLKKISPAQYYVAPISYTWLSQILQSLNPAVCDRIHHSNGSFGCFNKYMALLPIYIY